MTNSEYITYNFNEIQKKYIGYNDLNIINKNSLTIEDTMQEAIYNVLQSIVIYTGYTVQNFVCYLKSSKKAVNKQYKQKDNFEMNDNYIIDSNDNVDDNNNDVIDYNNLKLLFIDYQPDYKNKHK